MNEVLLERDLSVWAGNVVAQIAQAEKRAEMYAIALRAKEESETDEADIANHLLCADDPTSKRMARNLLHICAQYGLMEESHGRYTLTEDGEQVAATEQVFVPERGTPGRSGQATISCSGLRLWRSNRSSSRAHMTRSSASTRIANRQDPRSRLG